MIRAIPIIVILIVCSANADTPVTNVVADFESGVDYFGGGARRDDTVAAVGKASLWIATTFGNGAWRDVYCGRYLRLRHTRLTEVRFKVRSTNVNRFNVQLVDATGQTHQIKLALPPDGEWHSFTWNQFGGGEHWAGADDGTFHWPARAFAFLVPREAALNKARADIWFDHVEAVHY